MRVALALLSEKAHLNSHLKSPKLLGAYSSAVTRKFDRLKDYQGVYFKALDRV